MSKIVLFMIRKEIMRLCKPIYGNRLKGKNRAYFFSCHLNFDISPESTLKIAHFDAACLQMVHWNVQK